MSGDVDDPDALDEMCELELRIAVSHPETTVGLIGKEMVVKRAEFGREAMELVNESLRQDRERIEAQL